MPHKSRTKKALEARRAAQEAIGKPDVTYPRKVWGHRELLDQPAEFRWLAEGVYVEPTWGPTGGLAKSLKSYVSSVFDISIASGQPAFDRFKVPIPRPVRVYIGEGGKAPHIRRMLRLCERMGVNGKDIPLFTQFEVASIETEQFRFWLIEDLHLYEPGRVSIDPLYAYHGHDIKTSDLYSRGPMLARLSAPCTERGTCLNVVDHFKKTGQGSSLDQLAQAGMSEWADSWILLSVKSMDLKRGKFKLLMEIGSRQWGGSQYDLDLSLGAFDELHGEFVGDVDWKVSVGVGDSSQGKDEAYMEAQIIKLLQAEPWQHTQESCWKEIGGNKEKFRKVWQSLSQDGSIVQSGGFRSPWALSLDAE